MRTGCFITAPSIVGIRKMIKMHHMTEPQANCLSYNSVGHIARG